MKIPLTIPVTGEEEIRRVSEVISSRWLTQGPSVTEFEDCVTRYTGAAYAVATSNCTTALHIGLLLHGIGRGDEVVIPSYTWIATANVVRMVGARPVFADIDPHTFNITPETIAPCLSANTKLVMPVHQFGLPADIDSLMGLARSRDIPVLEDAACALGSSYKGRPIGSGGNIVCFSFHPRKLISTGEGGMLLTSRASMMQRARRLINHGASISDVAKHRSGTVEALLSEEFDEVGYNYRMTNLQGALGIGQMNRLDSILKRRQHLANRYTEMLATLSHVSVPKVPEYAEPNWQSYVITLDAACPVPRNRVAQALLNDGIAVRPAYMACHLQPIYRRDYPDVRLPNTEKALDTVLILPIYPEMTDQEQEYVVDRLRRATNLNGG